MNENLSQDEIDTLLSGVDNGDIDTESSNENSEQGEFKVYDFAANDRIIRGTMPTLDMINERVVRMLRVSMFNMLRRTTEVTAIGVSISKFSEYSRGLIMPTSLNIIEINPLRGNGLCVIDPKLVYATVDNFFGGDGRYDSRSDSDGFTPTEERVIQLLLNMIFTDLKKSWEPVLELDFKFQSAETNPQYANIVGSSEVVVISKFQIDLDGGGGEFHMVMPYTMIEPIRELLELGAQKDKDETSEHWENSIKEDIQQARIEIDSTMPLSKLTLEQVVNLNSGDVIPIEMPDFVTVRAGNVPFFRGVLGRSNGKNSVQFVMPVSRQE